MPQQPGVLVTGAGGFIGHHLTQLSKASKNYKEAQNVA
jgi:nucleoside-diphosphate-sugar epimerase